MKMSPVLQESGRGDEVLWRAVSSENYSGLEGPKEGVCMHAEARGQPCTAFRFYP